MVVPSGWMNTLPTGHQSVCFCQITHMESGTTPVFVKYSLLIRKDTTWQLHVHGHPIPPECPCIAGFPSQLNSVTTSELLSKLQLCHPCPGNPEHKFISLASLKKRGEFLSVSGNEVVAYLDKSGPVMINDQCYASTIHTTKCHLLTGELRCEVCKNYRKNLLAQHSRAMHVSTEQRSQKANYRLVLLRKC